MIYFVKRPDDGHIKIGTTVRLSRRLRELAAEFGEGLVVLAVVDGNHRGEGGLHRRFAHLQTVGEWFEPGDDLVGFIVAEGREWDGSDEEPLDLVSVKLDVDVVAEAKMVAAGRGLTLAEYLSEVLRPIVHTDLEQEWARRSHPKGEPEPGPKKAPKGKGGSK